MVINKSCLIFLFLLTAIAASLSGQAPQRNAVLYIIITAEENSSDEYSKVIEDAAKLEFSETRLIIRSVLPDNLPDQAAEFRLENPDILPEAIFLLQGRYSVQGSFINIAFTWLDLKADKTGSNENVAEEFSRRYYIDLSLDQQIGSLVSEIRETKMQRIESIGFIQPKQETERQAADMNEPQHDIVKVETNGAEQPKAGKLKGNILINAGFSVYLSTGKAVDYFDYGLLPAVSVSYIFHPRFGDIAVGIVSGLNIYQVNSVSPDSQSIIPAGINGAVHFTLFEHLRLSVGLSAGAAFMLINIYNDSWSKTMFYTSVEAGAAWQFGSTFGVELKAEYYIFFESADLITGFAPGISVFYRI